MADLDQLRAALGDIPVVTDPAKVQLKSRDFYWYSPVLKRQLERVCADLVVEPRDEAEVIRTLAACHRQRVPVTARGGGTGNYGQAMPLKGGVVLDLSRLDHIIEIGLGRVRAQAGAKLAQIDRACQEHSRQELRLHPSTLKMATIGGFVADGSSGVGSVGWGILRDRGNILAVRVVTMEAQPRVLELEGDAIQQVNHAYGTNGVITEVEMPLAPAHAWVDLMLGFADFTTAVRFADALARQDALTKKLITALAAPIAELYFRPLKSRIPDGAHVVLLMIGAPWLPDFRDFLKAWPAEVLLERAADDPKRKALPIFELSWNHTTLHALRIDPGARSHAPRAAHARALRRRGHGAPRVRALRRADRLPGAADRALLHRGAPGRNHPPSRGLRLPDLQPARLHPRGRGHEAGRPHPSRVQAQSRPGRPAQPRQDARLG
jgi:FAD/FMN-containing dehydrogenase